MKNSNLLPAEVCWR